MIVDLSVPDRILQSTDGLKQIMTEKESMAFLF
jgi:hypothetical protein